MLFQAFTTLLGCVIMTIQCRDVSKGFKSIPTITGSLVNLGKMDISFHFNTKDLPPLPKINNQNSFQSLRSEPYVEEPCPCSGLRNNFQNHPSDLLSKVLTSNDLFSFNKDPVSSTMCCGSHEHTVEDVVTFEFGPKAMKPKDHFNLPPLPLVFENILPRKPLVPAIMPSKPKQFEIFFFPKNKDAPFFPVTKKEIKKDEIQIVGDKELRNDFASLKFKPSFLNLQSSVKKDLTAQEKSETKDQIDKEEVETTTAGNSNAI
ncbi:hypothetical protein ABMA28_015169 [Loxostege sticticalis]|uniref:Uncharacterized protein n=1 Tax=Loxostege sticticalis TaxID=481309 RepID=A0ABD0TEN3_LOXSC